MFRLACPIDHIDIDIKIHLFGFLSATFDCRKNNDIGIFVTRDPHLSLSRSRHPRERILKCVDRLEYITLGTNMRVTITDLDLVTLETDREPGTSV